VQVKLLRLAVLHRGIKGRPQFRFVCHIIARAAKSFRDAFIARIIG